MNADHCPGCGASTLDRLERLADAALYLAKRQGRNRVELAESSPAADPAAPAASAPKPAANGSAPAPSASSSRDPGA